MIEIVKLPPHIKPRNMLDIRFYRQIAQLANAVGRWLTPEESNHIAMMFEYQKQFREQSTTLLSYFPDEDRFSLIIIGVLK
jgi:hypothetical protein